MRNAAGRALVVTVVAAGACFIRPAAADGEAVRVDATALRYYAPETGGAARPFFLTERVLSFQARLEAKGEDSDATAPQDRHVRAAADRLVVEGVLAALPRERATDAKEMALIVALFRQAITERLGEGVLDEAARLEGLSQADVRAILFARARAAVYADRALGPVLYPSEELLREVFRTTPHPYRGRRFEDVRAGFTAYFVEDRLRVLETAFLQAARSRIRVLPVR